MTAPTTSLYNSSIKTLIHQDLETHPSLALQLDIATKILFEGMITGIFTGRKLAQYFNKTTDNWIDAREIINRHDKANLIARYGHEFYSAISYTDHTA
jgi:putative chitinase